MISKKNMNSFCGFSRSEEEIKHEKEKQRIRFKMTYPGKDAYVFPDTKKHNSPCMSKYWLHKPIYQGSGKKAGNSEHDKIEYEEVEEDPEDGD